jgi:protein SCO1/2
MNRRSLLLAGAATTLAPFIARPSARAAVTHQFGEAWFTNVVLQTHEGKTVRFYDDLLKGKGAIINFMFTRCDGICPGMTQNLTYVQELLGPRVGRDIFMYSITIDPEHDTPERLAQYASPFDIGPGWLFLTGAKPDIELLRARLGFVDSNPAQDADPDQHTGTVRIGNEPLHRWIMAPGLAKPEAIVRAVDRVIPV